MLFTPLNDLRQVVQALRTHSLREVMGLIAEVMEYRLGQRFDRIHGVDTWEYVPLSRLGFAVGEAHRSGDYRATPVRTLRTLLARLPRDVISSSPFVDFGSGKGRALLVAADFAFRRIIGVEFSEELHRIAETNLRVYRGHTQRCFDLSSVHARAEEFALPDENLVLYFFNPFEEETMARVLSNVARAGQKSPRVISLLFFHLRFRFLVEQCGIFREIALNP